jgi:Planctomycete cytochrome C/WD domain, G-beta repeat
MLQSRDCCYCILCSLLGLALAWLMFFATAPAARAQDQVSFIKDVAPILKENCFACHDAKFKKGKLDMTTFATFRLGGNKDDPVVDGKSRDSVIIHLLTSMGKDRMPPIDMSKPLPKKQIDVIARWIDAGAKLDAGIDPKASLVRELRVRWQPPQPPAVYKFPNVITSLAFTPEGDRLVVGGHHELLIWNVESAKLERRVFTRAERTFGMVFLADGKLAVAAGRPGQEGDIRIYDLKAGTPKDHGGIPSVDGVNDKTVLVKVLGDADDAMLALAVSPDGTKLAAGGCDRLIRVWHLPSGKLEQTFENHADWILALAFAPDGNGLVSGSRDRTAKIWDLTTKESLVAFGDHQAGVYAVAITPDGLTGISGAEDGTIRMWQATDKTKQIGKQSKVLGSHGKTVLRMASWIDSKGDSKHALLASCGADGSVKLFNPITGTALKTGTGFTDWVYAVAISPDGQQVAGGCYNGDIRIFKVSDGTLVQSFNATPGAMATRK